MTYAEFCAARADLETQMALAEVTMSVFPKGPMGLTPDHVKAMPEFRAAKADFNAAFQALRTLNQTHLKRFAAEERAAREARRNQGKLI